MSRRAPATASTVGLREAAAMLRIPQPAVAELVESDRLPLHGFERGRPVFLRADVVALAAHRTRRDASLLGLFQLPGETRSAWDEACAAVRRRHAAEDRRFAQLDRRRDRPAPGEGPRIVWLRFAGVCCAGCSTRLSSGRDHVRIESDGERWWLCERCGEASGAVLPQPPQVERRRAC